MTARALNPALRALLWLRFGPPPGGSGERADEAILAETGPDLGAPKAITATAHELARFVDNLGRYGETYVRREEAAFAEQVRERQEKQLHRRAKELGFEVRRVAPPGVEPSPGVDVPSTPA